MRGGAHGVRGLFVDYLGATDLMLMVHAANGVLGKCFWLFWDLGVVLLALANCLSAVGQSFLFLDSCASGKKLR